MGLTCAADVDWHSSIDHRASWPRVRARCWERCSYKGPIHTCKTGAHSPPLPNRNGQQITFHSSCACSASGLAGASFTDRVGLAKEKVCPSKNLSPWKSVTYAPRRRVWRVTAINHTCSVLNTRAESEVLLDFSLSVALTWLKSS